MSEPAADPVSAVLEALGDPTRREIYERILTRPSRILFLAETAAVSRPAISHHVRILKAAGLVRAERGVLVATTDVLPMLGSISTGCGSRLPSAKVGCETGSRCRAGCNGWATWAPRTRSPPRRERRETRVVAAGRRGAA
jgi:hypothetical protein